MADVYELSKLKSFSDSSENALSEFKRLTGISKVVMREVKSFGHYSCYVELLNALVNLLPEDISISDINGFEKSEIENSAKTKPIQHIHFKINGKPYCIKVEGNYGGFEDSFLIQLNSGISDLGAKEKFLLVFCYGLKFVDEVLHWAYLTPEKHLELVNHSLQFADDRDETARLEPEHPVSECELQGSLQKATRIRHTHEISSGDLPLKFIQCINNISTYDINSRGLFYLNFDGDVPGIHTFQNYKTNGGCSIALHSNQYLHCRSGFYGFFLYDFERKDFLIKDTIEIDNKSFTGIGSNLWGENIWQVARTSDDSNFNRDKHHKTDFYSLDLENNTLSPMQNEVRYSIDKGHVLLGFLPKSNSLHALNREGEIIWTYTIEGTYKSLNQRVLDKSVKTMFGVYDDLIWFSIENDKIIALSKTDGKLVHSIKNAEHYGMFLDMKNGWLISHKVRIDLNSKSPQVEAIPTTNNNPHKHFFPNTSKIESDTVCNRIFIIDTSKATIALKNLENGEYEWHYDLYESIDHVGLISAKRFENQLCVLDANHDLHVFEVSSKWM